MALNNTTQIYAQSVDPAGNASPCSLMLTYTHDDVTPVVENVRSTVGDGGYKVGQIIPIEVRFSENVTVTGVPQLTLETGGSDAVVQYDSGSGSNVLVFKYTVGSNQTATRLDYVSNAALVLNGGKIQDKVQSDANLTLPNPGASGSLGSNNNILIDTAIPVITYSSVSPASPGTGRTPAITMALSENSTVTLYSNSGCSNAISAATALSGASGQTITTNTLNANASTTIYAKAVDGVTNESICTSMIVYTHDDIAPTISSFGRAVGQSAFTNSLPMNFAVRFSEAIDPTTFTASDISNTGTAAGVTWTVSDSGDHKNFTVAATAAANGTLKPSFAASAVNDPAGNMISSVSTSSNDVAYSVAAFTVTLNQAAGQVDPANTLPISYTVVF